MKLNRFWLVLVAGLLAGCATAPTHAARGPVGLQLYSLRTQLATNIPGTLDEVKSWGIKYVELAGTYKDSPAQFKHELQSRGLTAVSAHFGYEKWRDDPEGALNDAEQLGVKYVGCAWIPHQGAFDEVACRQAAVVFNHAADVAAKHHMTFFYHAHGYEFGAYENGTMFDLLVKETTAHHVQFEMDIFWIAFAGQSAPDLLEKYPNRWELMHLKDMRLGTPTNIPIGSTDKKSDVALGTGELDMTAILKAAGKVGVKWYFIEDESPTSEEQIPVSLKYLGLMK